MLISAASNPAYAVQPFNGPDSRAPSTPFAVTQENAKINWKDEFLGGLVAGLGINVVPISDAQTPNYPVTGNAPAFSTPVGNILSNPVVSWGLVAAVGFLTFKALKGR